MTATIALVDDDRNILQSLSIALQAEGFVTRVYSDGEAALRPLIGSISVEAMRSANYAVDRDQGKVSPAEAARALHP